MRRTCLMGGSMVLIAAAVLLSQPTSEPKSHPPALNLRAFGPVHPRLSPDGTRIAFSYQGAIWTMPSAGGVMKRLTSGEGLEVEPTWSPDGKAIAFIATRNFSAGRLRLVTVETGRVTDLPGDPFVYGKLAIHPDGKRILGSFQLPNFKGESLAWFDTTAGTLTPATDPPRPARQVALSADGKKNGSPSPPTRTCASCNRAMTGRRRTCGECRPMAASRRKSPSGLRAFTTSAGPPTARACS